jgi:hypothetical protein
MNIFPYYAGGGAAACKSLSRSMGRGLDQA